MNKIYYAFIFLALVFSSCKAPEKISLYDLSFLYRDNDFTELEAIIFHDEQDFSTVFVRVNMADLKYEKMEDLPVYTSSYKISYKLSPSYEARHVIDSATYSYFDTLHFGKDVSKTESFRIAVSTGQKYILAIELTDMNMSEKVKTYIEIDKTEGFGQQDFVMLNENLLPMFRNFVGPKERFLLRAKDEVPNNIHVSCYFRDFPVARPPFLEERDPSFDYRPDSIFIIQPAGDSTNWITLEREGFYHFRSDTTSKAGYTVYRFHDNFPELSSVDQLAGPIRYITTKKEYTEVAEAEEKKAALDDFWLRTAGNPARARTVLQKYYNNVQDANRFFTSYKEGWKTDRGLIYVIYGKPNVVYRGQATEEWIYGEPDHRNSLRFTFVKVINPFTMNDYMLLRSPTYKDPWYITVQSWRR